MRLKLYFELENESITIQYRKCILSFIKKSLAEYSKEYYKKLYNEKDPIIKSYTFAIFFNHPKFIGDEIIIEDKKFQLIISIADMEIAMALYNAFNHQKFKIFSLNKNSWQLKNIDLVNEKRINSNSIKVKFLSPLVVRSREFQKDYYYSYGTPEFLDILKINIKNQLKITSISPSVVETFEIEAESYKKAIIKFYEKKIECTLGTFKLTGDKELLKYLYEAGMGSKRSAGFGMFYILG